MPGAGVEVRVEAVHIAVRTVAVNVAFPLIPLPYEQVFSTYPYRYIKPLWQPGGALGEKRTRVHGNPNGIRIIVFQKKANQSCPVDIVGTVLQGGGAIAAGRGNGVNAVVRVVFRPGAQLQGNALFVPADLLRNEKSGAEQVGAHIAPGKTAGRGKPVKNFQRRHEDLATGEARPGRRIRPDARPACACVQPAAFVVGQKTVAHFVHLVPVAQVVGSVEAAGGAVGYPVPVQDHQRAAVEHRCGTDARPKPGLVQAVGRLKGEKGLVLAGQTGWREPKEQAECGECGA